MSYYQGDFYRGDPGFFSFLGGLAKKAIGFIPGVGPIASATVEGLTRASGRTPAGAVSMIRKGAVGMARKAGAIVVKHPVLSGAAAAGVIGAGGVMGGRQSMRAGRMAGMRRHRRMNVCNVKALRRSIRRTHGFAKLAMRTIHLVHPKKHARFGGFKKRRRKAA
jgi:hypothetical protein